MSYSKPRHRCEHCTLWHAPFCPDLRRWPLAPLEALTGPVNGRWPLSGTELANIRENGLSDPQADRWAIRAGYHPAMIWDSWVDAGLTVMDRMHVYGGGWRQAWLAAETGAHRGGSCGVSDEPNDSKPRARRPAMTETEQARIRLENNWTAELRREAADALLVIANLACIEGFDLADAVDERLAVVLARDLDHDPIEASQ